MGLNEKEQVFKVHWVEKLKMVFKLIYIPVLFFFGVEIFFGFFNK